jgi:hypothetical protein
LLALVPLLGFSRPVPAVELTGTWKLTAKMRDGDREAVLQVKRAGEKLSGTFASDSGTVPIEQGAIQGNAFQFRVVLRERNGDPIPLQLKGTLTGGALSGTVESDRYPATFKGVRVPAPAQKEVRPTGKR